MRMRHEPGITGPSPKLSKPPQTSSQSASSVSMSATQAPTESPRAIAAASLSCRPLCRLRRLTTLSTAHRISSFAFICENCSKGRTSFQSCVLITFMLLRPCSLVVLLTAPLLNCEIYRTCIARICRVYGSSAYILGVSTCRETEGAHIGHLMWVHSDGSSFRAFKET